jgi:phage terminase large subunit-like protein
MTDETAEPKQKPAEDKGTWQSITEEIEVAGHTLIEEVKRLIAEGNARKLRVRSRNDDVMIEVPVTAGAVAGGVVVLAAPWLAILGAVAGLLSKVRIEIVRDEETGASAEAKSPGPGA